MARLNAHAAETVSQCPEIHACTDVTGFGLLGHADEMARGSGVTIRLYSRRLPLLPGALEFAEMGIIPAGVIRLTMPELTEDRRKEYVKLAKSKAEDGKVAVRNIRRKAKETIDKSVKDGEMGEDEGDRLLKELDKVTKQVTDQLDALFETKQKEIMEV